MNRTPQHDPRLTMMEEDDERTERVEWEESMDALLAHAGPARARRILDTLSAKARQANIGWKPDHGTPYLNTVPLADQPPYPGDLAIEESLVSIMRWNALAMVVRANKAYGELGGHIASYASAADLFEVGFNHFFRGHHHPDGGDLVFFQPHSAPGIYGRAYLEGRLTEDDLSHFRQEVTGARAGGRGLSSYPHPWLMPDFWQFPTGSMGIGPINSIYQARFMRYLTHRGLLDTGQRRVWGVFGDGEMDEPESMSALTMAAREGLDNLTWIINCNLQRLDGPVRGNGRIVDELESLFAGAGWNVVKLLWGSDWDPLFERDTDGSLAAAFADTVDGQLQTFAAKDGHYNREHFFGQNEALQRLAADLNDAQIDRLKRGGHDLQKIHAAYAAAAAHRGRPTVILAQTKKGFGMGEAGQGKMSTHQQKKLDTTELLAFRDRFKLPLSDSDAEHLHFYKPSADSPELRYLNARREALGGPVPQRRTACEPVVVPARERYARFATDADGKEMATTMAFVRILAGLLKDDTLGPRVVPIVADEARTFGMASLFRQTGIYSSVGQHYEPEDIDSILSYREAKDGQILEEGINEAGAISSWVAAGTSYSTHGLAMLPFYIYYSIFGFQRVGDLIWAAADQRVRGFLLGATSGRTTLSGEGLQHQDGHSHLIAATVPNCRAYDPAFVGELAVIVDHGMRRMLEAQVDEFYYITLMNEKYPQASLPAGCEASIIKGMYHLRQAVADTPRGSIRLLGSGAILPEVLTAATMLASDWQISSDVYSVTSFTELARDAQATDRWNRLHPADEPRQSHLSQCLPGLTPVLAASDYLQAVPQLVAGYVDARFRALGTDGFGRSDQRNVLRDFFEVSHQHIVVAALSMLAQHGDISPTVVIDAIHRYGLDADASAPWEV